MHKSTDDTASGHRSSITVDDVGHRVHVSHIGWGVLMYFGRIHGKEGVYCGVALDSPQGKHNGTYQGVTYFDCEDRHGIFAPPYMVEVDRRSFDGRRSEKLVRSAMPAIRDPSPSMDVSMVSIGSVGSPFDSSFVMNGSWDADAMASSNATFTITKGNQCEYQFLDEIEFPANLIDIEEDSVSELSSESPSENRMNSTVTLEESRFDPNHLPIVEDDASTPLIEYCPFLESSADNFSVTMPLTSPVLPTATSPSRPTSSNSKMSISSGDSSNHLDSKTTSAPSKKPIEIVPKKPKHQSIREIQNAPLPKRTLKPKPPSKSQIMMERLKASIAADKQKPKKEIKSRLGELLSAPTPVSSDINRDCRKNTSGEKEAGKRASSPTVKRRKPEPLKPNNNKINEEQAASNSSSKQRQSHLPPPKGTSKLSKPNTASRPVTKFVPPNSVSAQKSSSDENKAKSSRLLSASEMNEHSSGTKCVRKTNTEMRDEKSSMTEEEKHRRLKHAVDGFDVLGVLFNYMTTSMEKLLNKNSALEHQLFEQNRERQKQLENVISSFKEQLDEKTNRFETELAKCREAALLKEDDMIARQNELEQMCRSQQLEYAHLASKLADLESANEQLINDKKRLEQTLCKDTNSKVAKLSEEIRSLNAALEMKSTEMRELRHLNATLQLKLEVVPMKDIEISKLKHRVQELKAVVDQKLITERVLTSKYEELQKSARYQAEVSESMLKENDILRYKIEEMESTSENETPSNVTKYYTPVSSRSSVRFRNSDSRGEGRPASCIVQSRVCHSARGETGTQRNSTEESPLSKSVVSMYLENGRSRSSNRNIDTIYTPEGTFIAHGTGKSRKLSFSSCDQPDLSPAVLQTNGENSSGGADGDRTVMDSGISI